MEALRLEGLSKHFGKLQAVQDISLSLRIGERRGIIGPNGAGKTTLFNLISGKLSPNGGKIYLFNQDITVVPEHRRVHLGLSRLPQITNLFLNLSVVDNVLLGLQAVSLSQLNLFRPISAYKELWERAQELLEPWDLWEKRDNPTRQLAYGEQRQLELILSLSSRPKLLLLDEPTSGMTPAEVGSIANIIHGIGKDVTIILVAHDMDFIFGLDLDYITVLHYGQIVAEGSPQEIKADPRVKEVYLGGGEDTENAAPN